MKFKKILRNKWIIASAIIIGLIVVGIVFCIAKSKPQDEVMIVKSGTVSSGVSVTGKVKAREEVNLSFEKTGRVTAVYKQSGDQVKAGDNIAVISNADAKAQVAQAEAAVAIQRAHLNELEVGTRPESIDITQTKAVGAEIDLAQARSSLQTAIQTAYSSAEDAVHSQVDTFYINARTTYPEVVFQQVVIPPSSLEQGRIDTEKDLDALRVLISALPTRSDVLAASQEAEDHLTHIKSFLDSVAFSVTALSPTQFVSQTSITTWKGNVATARSEINTALAGLNSAQDKYASAQTSASVAGKQLTLDKAGSVNQQIEGARAQVAQAEANLQAAYAELNKTYIKAPFDGVITKEDITVGEIATTNTSLISIIGNGSFEIEAQIPEADLAKIAVGEKASVTLDAYGPDVVFDAAVDHVDASETIVDNVPTYKAVLEFTTEDDRIKSGMTANVDVQGETHENVLSVPQRAIINHDGAKFVKVRNGKTTTEVEVKTGIRGTDGAVEIVNGLSEGDSVVVSTATQ